MKYQIRRPALGSAMMIVIILAVSACGGKQTVASKSAAAFREAQKKGTPMGGDSHGGHSASGEGTMPGMDHSTMTGADGAGTDHSKMQGGQSMPGMDHSKMQSGQSMAGMDHSKMQSGQSMAGMDHPRMQGGQSMAGMDHSNMKSGQSMAGMDHSKMQGGQSMPGMDHSTMKNGQSMAGMDHSKMQGGQSMAGMDHSNMAGMQDMGAATSKPPPITNLEIQQIEPASTLKVDPFDTPAGVAVAEAVKSMSGGGHEGMTMNHGEADAPVATPAPAMDHSQHGGSSPAAVQPATPRTTPRTSTAKKSAPTAASIYSCPMHPEVRSDKPGKCPKCGMTLVKKK